MDFNDIYDEDDIDGFYDYGHVIYDLYYPDEFDYPTEEEERRIEREEYEYNHGVCSTCGGEWGDGWTTCTCDD